MTPAWQLPTCSGSEGVGLTLLYSVFVFSPLCTDTETQAVSPNAEPTGHPAALSGALAFLCGHCYSSETFKSCLTQHKVRLRISVNGNIMSLMCRNNRAVNFQT